MGPHIRESRSSKRRRSLIRYYMITATGKSKPKSFLRIVSYSSFEISFRSYKPAIDSNFFLNPDHMVFLLQVYLYFQSSFLVHQTFLV